MKHELLVPAGDMNCLRQAVFNGCDAVYVGCKMFGARKFAPNFTQDEITEAIRFCHLYGVRLYVTMNTLVKNDEVDAFIQQVRFLHQCGVDALIVQDFGMICYLREKFPNLEIHASTQANISSYEVCQLYYNLGVKRVVFARELSIDEIDQIDVDIEKEAFIHGALCISYSGCCLMSSMLGGRSGNRGECTGCCRIPYTLKNGNKVVHKQAYLLSTKELNTSSYINRLMNSSIYSFKIEGRMKSPVYVGLITRFYRKLMDGEEIDFLEYANQLKTIFNRDFTKGRIFSADDFSLMNSSSPNHIGLEIGKVLGSAKGKIQIQLKNDKILHQYDAIRFLHSNQGFVVNYLYDKNFNLVSSAKGICYVDQKVSLKDSSDVVCKTQDYLLGEDIKQTIPKKIPVFYHVVAKRGKPFLVELSDGEHRVCVEGEVVQEARNAPVCEDDLLKHLKKIGNTPLVCISCDMEMDSDIFVAVRQINDIRRKLVSELISLREGSSVPYLEEDVSFQKSDSFIGSNRSLHCLVRTEEQLKACMELQVPYISVSNLELYNQYKDSYSLSFAIPRCSYQVSHNLVDSNLVSDYFDFRDFDCMGDYGLNVTNIYTAYYLSKIGLSSICLSVELSQDEVCEFLDLYQKKFGNFSFEVFSYGRVLNMLIKGNILQLDPLKNYSLVDFKGRSFPVYYDGRCTYVFHYENFDKKFSWPCIYRCDFYDESGEDVKKIVKRYQD